MKAQAVVVVGKIYSVRIPPIENYCCHFNIEGEIVALDNSIKEFKKGDSKVLKSDDLVWIKINKINQQVRAEWLGERMNKSMFKMEIRIDGRIDKLFITADNKYKKCANELACIYRPKDAIIIAVYDDNNNMLYSDIQVKRMEIYRADSRQINGKSGN